LSFVHETVLRDEVVQLLKPVPGKRLVDATLGGGGHAEALLAAGADVIGVDRDPSAIAAAGARLSGSDRFRPLEGRAGELEALLGPLGLLPVDGLLLDLGVSSPQLDTPGRGFSFQSEGPLDMRMGRTGETAAELIARLSEAELAAVLRELGEEPFARPIARALKHDLPATTQAAVASIKRAVPRKAWPSKVHVATRTFQALRIAVNDELGELERVLAALPQLLRLGGRAAVIAFHSLEDRAVKQAFRTLEGRCTCPPGLPVCACGAQGTFRVLTRRAVQATDAEVERNPRARSARLRAVERVA
jgi:16S rRNA (cytosine1402-N4)-methyltransferase